MNTIKSTLILVSILSFAVIPAHSQTGTVEHITIHGKSLEGNLEGDSPDRSVSVYLPPSYGKNPHRRYPVVYFLHGYTDSDD